MIRIRRLIRDGARYIAGLGALAVPMIAFADPLGNIGTVPSSSDFPTMWTAGDPAPIAAALNAIAMLFGHGDVAGSFIAGGMSALSLVGLVGVLLHSIFKMRLMIGEYVLMMIIAILMFYPTTSVRVVSYFNANGAAGSPPLYVDNVPIGVAYALGIAGMINYRVTSGIETAFSTASSDNNFMSLGTDGFAKPLKIMLAMRTMYDCNVHQSTCTNLLNFMHYCKTGGANQSSVLDMTQLDKPAPGAGIAGLLLSQPLNYTVYIDQSVPSASPALVPCQTAANGLVNSMQQYVQNKPVFEMLSPGGVTMGQDLATVTAMVDSTVDTPGTTYTGPDAAYQTQAQYYQNLAAQIGGDANTFMMNQVFSPAALAAIRADANPNAAAAFQQIMGEAYERARISMAASGSMFVNFMTSAMNLMTFLFAALAPIVAIIAIGAGLAAVRIYVMYFLFGLWTQTWMPIAAIISYYTQVSFNSMIRGSRVSGMMFAPSQIDHLYDNVANMLASSGSMMASAPLISFSVLTGSIFAMTSLANRSSGNGEQYVDSGRLAPTVDRASNAGAIESAYANNTGTAWSGFSSWSRGSGGGLATTSAGMGVGGLLGGAAPVAMTGADVGAMASVSTSTSLGQGVAERASAQASYQRSLGSAMERIGQYAQQYGVGAASQLTTSLMSKWDVGNDVKSSVGARVEDTLRNSSNMQNQTTTSESASGKLGLGRIFGGGGNGGSASRGGGDIGAGVGADVSQSMNKSTTVGGGTSEVKGYDVSGHASDGQGGQQVRQGSTSSEARRQESASETARAFEQMAEAYQRVQASERSLQASSNVAAQAQVSLGVLAQRGQQSTQDVQQSALSAARSDAGRIAGIATGHDSTRSSALLEKAFRGVDTQGFTPYNMGRMMRNASELVQSNDTGEQAVGYAMAGAVARSIQYPGGGKAISQNAQYLASASQELEAVRSSMTPGLSGRESANTRGLEKTVPAAVADGAKNLGVKAGDYAPIARHLTEGSVGARAAGVGGKVDSVGAGFAAGSASEKTRQTAIQHDGMVEQIHAREKAVHGEDSQLPSFTKAPAASDVRKSVEDFSAKNVDGQSIGGGG
ncbi:conjugal transfer protein TraG N-terminal domain-containing protein [Burkholderia sp. MBR-1]|uniref:conjugal transfer protein TraG N-terminal domain-containing protein n=1 Tax=Burkholderia sp. MBR-1 TaxID=2732364 RepID=UPI0015EF6C9E|nr:conjugal transfer protein TraG N-terminal domain-containing protein [Burkholderia sp. MBR-1]QMI49759.1 sex pilus assembly protein TraG [Burkholderia sp. MBR-1]